MALDLPQAEDPVAALQLQWFSSGYTLLMIYLQIEQNSWNVTPKQDVKNKLPKKKSLFHWIEHQKNRKYLNLINLTSLL